MKEIYLGFKAYDVHELLCHAIAEAGGMYARAGIRAKLIDTTFLPEDAIPVNTFHVACGAALGDFLSGLNRKVLFVACDRPMFWLYGRAGVDRMGVPVLTASSNWRRGGWRLFLQLHHQRSSCKNCLKTKE
jgi:hypothetical protein